MPLRVSTPISNDFRKSSLCKERFDFGRDDRIVDVFTCDLSCLEVDPQAENVAIEHEKNKIPDKHYSSLS